MSYARLFCHVWLTLPTMLLGAEVPAVSGDAELTGVIGGKPVVIRTTSRLAGAIDSVRWDGVEFIDSQDHGRQLQSALNADFAGVVHLECYNPTEAGSAADGSGPTSSSVLESLTVRDGTLTTRTRMAYWLAPGMRSGVSGQPAQNTVRVSGHVLSKRVRIGRPGMDHVLDYQVTFTVPGDHPHRFLQFEALTGYMPPAFAQAFAYEAATERLVPLSRENGEVSSPVVLSTASGAHAMGVFTPDRPAAGMPPVGYGRFFFAQENVAKWNCVFRLRQDRPIPPGEHRFQLYVVLGTREDCRRTLAALAREFPRR